MRRIIYIFIVLFLISGLVGVISSLKPNVICANTISCTKNLSVDIENNSIGIFQGQKIVAPSIDLAADNSTPHVLGDSTATGEKHIYVNLNTQTLYAYQGSTLFMQTFISSGKWHPTPDGDYKIWVKLRATRMTGGSGADYYDLPNVPFVMFFANSDVPESAGYSLHGAYWHTNFGHPMSHGCVNMRIVDAQKLYDWVDDPSVNGTPVTIYGQAPL